MLMRLTVVLAFFAFVFPQPGKLETISEAVPEEISPSIRETLPISASRVVMNSGVIATFWIRENIDLKDSSSPELGVNFGQFPIGTLIGAFRISGPWKDYKNTVIEEGTYTMRYARQPADGDHLGATLYRDFLILLPAERDNELDREYSQQDLIDMGRLASHSTHPAVLAFFPIWESIESTSLLQNELDQTTLAVKKGDLILGLVMVGHGELEGY
jgi:hypothetical protein